MTPRPHCKLPAVTVSTRPTCALLFKTCFSFPVYVCVYCASCTYVLVCTEGPYKNNLECHASRAVTLFYWFGLFLFCFVFEVPPAGTWSLLVRLGWLGTKPQGTSCLHVPSAEVLATRPAFSFCGSWRVRPGLPSPDDSDIVVNSVDTLGLLTALCTSRLKESSNSRVFTTRHARACARDHESTNSPAHEAMHTAKLLTNSTGGCSCDRDWEKDGSCREAEQPCGRPQP